MEFPYASRPKNIPVILRKGAKRLRSEPTKDPKAEAAHSRESRKESATTGEVRTATNVASVSHQNLPDQRNKCMLGLKDIISYLGQCGAVCETERRASGGTLNDNFETQSQQILEIDVGLASNCADRGFLQSQRGSRDILFTLDTSGSNSGKKDQNGVQPTSEVELSNVISLIKHFSRHVKGNFSSLGLSLDNELDHILQNVRYADSAGLRNLYVKLQSLSQALKIPDVEQSQLESPVDKPNLNKTVKSNTLEHKNKARVDRSCSILWSKRDSETVVLDDSDTENLLQSMISSSPNKELTMDKRLASSALDDIDLSLFPDVGSSPRPEETSFALENHGVSSQREESESSVKDRESRTVDDEVSVIQLKPLHQLISSSDINEPNNPSQSLSTMLVTPSESSAQTQDEVDMLSDPGFNSRIPPSESITLVHPGDSGELKVRKCSKTAEKGLPNSSKQKETFTSIGKLSNLISNNYISTKLPVSKNSNEPTKNLLDNALTPIPNIRIRQKLEVTAAKSLGVSAKPSSAMITPRKKMSYSEIRHKKIMKKCHTTLETDKTISSPAVNKENRGISSEELETAGSSNIVYSQVSDSRSTGKLIKKGSLNTNEPSLSNEEEEEISIICVIPGNKSSTNLSSRSSFDSGASNKEASTRKTLKKLTSFGKSPGVESAASKKIRNLNTLNTGKSKNINLLPRILSTDDETLEKSIRDEDIVKHSLKSVIKRAVSKAVSKDTTTSLLSNNSIKTSIPCDKAIKNITDKATSSDSVNVENAGNPTKSNGQSLTIIEDEEEISSSYTTPGTKCNMTSSDFNKTFHNLSTKNSQQSRLHQQIIQKTGGFMKVFSYLEKIEDPIRTLISCPGGGSGQVEENCSSIVGLSITIDGDEEEISSSFSNPVPKLDVSTKDLNDLSNEFPTAISSHELPRILAVTDLTSISPDLEIPSAGSGTNIYPSVSSETFADINYSQEHEKCMSTGNYKLRSCPKDNGISMNSLIIGTVERGSSNVLETSSTSVPPTTNHATVVENQAITSTELEIAENPTNLPITISEIVLEDCNEEGETSSANNQPLTNRNEEGEIPIIQRTPETIQSVPTNSLKSSNFKHKVRANSSLPPNVMKRMKEQTNAPSIVRIVPPPPTRVVYLKTAGNKICKVVEKVVSKKSLIAKGEDIESRNENVLPDVSDKNPAQITSNMSKNLNGASSMKEKVVCSARSRESKGEKEVHEIEEPCKIDKNKLTENNDDDEISIVCFKPGVKRSISNPRLKKNRLLNSVKQISSTSLALTANGKEIRGGITARSPILEKGLDHYETPPTLLEEVVPTSSYSVEIEIDENQSSVENAIHCDDTNRVNQREVSVPVEQAAPIEESGCTPSAVVSETQDAGEPIAVLTSSQTTHLKNRKPINRDLLKSLVEKVRQSGGAEIKDLRSNAEVNILKVNHINNLENQENKGEGITEVNVAGNHFKAKRKLIGIPINVMNGTDREKTISTIKEHLNELLGKENLANKFKLSSSTDKEEQVSSKTIDQMNCSKLAVLKNDNIPDYLKDYIAKIAPDLPIEKLVVVREEQEKLMGTSQGGANECQTSLMLEPVVNLSTDPKTESTLYRSNQRMSQSVQCHLKKFAPEAKHIITVKEDTKSFIDVGKIDIAPKPPVMMIDSETFKKMYTVNNLASVVSKEPEVLPPEVPMEPKPKRSTAPRPPVPRLPGQRLTKIHLNDEGKKLLDSFRKLQSRNKMLRQRIKLLKSLVKDPPKIKHERVIKELENYLSTEIHAVISNVIMQKAKNYKKKGLRFSDTLKKFAVSLYLAGPKVYKSWQTHFVMPNISTVKKCLHHFLDVSIPANDPSADSFLRPPPSEPLTAANLDDEDESESEDETGQDEADSEDDSNRRNIYDEVNQFLNFK